jgi:hypothetical protein
VISLGFSSPLCGKIRFLFAHAYFRRRVFSQYGFKRGGKAFSVYAGPVFKYKRCILAAGVPAGGRKGCRIGRALPERGADFV